MRKTPLVSGEYYHIYNRGVDKRTIFQDNFDLERFFLSMLEFNSKKPIGSIYENSFKKGPTPLGGETAKWSGVEKAEKLVDIITYCLNPNHYHLILKQNLDNGISEFMKRLNGGYTWYFNNRHKRNGALFQGVFKSIHIDSDKYLLHLSAYINLNNKLGEAVLPLSKSSWNEYTNKNPDGICKTNIVLEQFNNPKEYRQFALDSLNDIVERKKQEKELLEFF